MKGARVGNLERVTRLKKRHGGGKAVKRPTSKIRKKWRAKLKAIRTIILLSKKDKKMGGGGKEESLGRVKKANYHMADCQRVNERGGGALLVGGEGMGGKRKKKKGEVNTKRQHTACVENI